MSLTAEQQCAHALRSIARNQEIKAYLQQSKDLYSLFQRVATRFVIGEIQEEALAMVRQLLDKEYRVSIEYIGENTATEQECAAAKEEYLALIQQAGSTGANVTVSFDLSHIGLSVDEDLASLHLNEMAEEAASHGVYLMIGMEESAKTDRILNLYKRAAKKHDNVGMTLQAHLKRSSDIVKDLLQYRGKIRIVKGAYQEPSDIAYARSQELNRRYIELVNACVQANHPVSIATHDEAILHEIIELEYKDNTNVELEMLYGIRPNLLKQLKADGYQTRVYVPYGTEWYLYICHRIAEHPPNLYTAVADLIQPLRLEQNGY